MVRTSLPAWALAPAALKLVIESFRHPNEDKVIIASEDGEDRKVFVVPANGGAETR